MPAETNSTDPSLTAGATMPSPDELLRTSMSAVVPLFEMEESQAGEAISAYVTERVAALSPTDTKTSIGLASGGTETFIGPETEMIMSALLSKPYYMNDQKAYEAAFPYIRAKYPTLTDKLPPERAYLNAVLYGVNFGQAVYFGSYVGNLDRRLSVAADIISDDDELDNAVSIADFKDSAMCQERAGVAHNGLLVFGITSKFETGQLAVKEDDGTVETEPHAFLTILSTNGSRYLYDPTNPVVYRNEEGHIVTIAPAFYKLEPDANGRQEVELREFTIVDGEAQETLRRSLVYTLDQQPTPQS